MFFNTPTACGGELHLPISIVERMVKMVEYKTLFVEIVSDDG
jgi:hypothetical protein